MKILKGFVVALLLGVCARAAVVPAFVQKLECVRGWNLFTVNRPLLPGSEATINELLSGMNVMTFDPIARMYVSCDKMEDIKPGVAYWYYSDEPKSGGSAIELPQTAADWTAPALKRGWNFVGYVEGKVNWGEDAVVWGWNGKCFEQVKPGDLKAGKGYWVYVGK